MADVVMMRRKSGKRAAGERGECVAGKRARECEVQAYGGMGPYFGALPREAIDGIMRNVMADVPSNRVPAALVGAGERALIDYGGWYRRSPEERDAIVGGLERGSWQERRAACAGLFGEGADYAELVYDGRVCASVAATCVGFVRYSHKLDVVAILELEGSRRLMGEWKAHKRLQDGLNGWPAARSDVEMSTMALARAMARGGGGEWGHNPENYLRGLGHAMEYIEEDDGVAHEVTPLTLRHVIGKAAQARELGVLWFLCNKAVHASRMGLDTQRKRFDFLAPIYTETSDKGARDMLFRWAVCTDKAKVAKP